MPSEISLGAGSVQVDSVNFQFNLIDQAQNSEIVRNAALRYRNLLFPLGAGTAGGLSFCSVRIASADETLDLGVDESYSLTVTTADATIVANTVWGALRGLETFSQMVTFDDTTGTYNIAEQLPAFIKDQPRFPWRGLLVDTARHFLSVKKLLHILDSMSYNKFNTLHWHLVDAESFPFVSESYPLLSARGAWAPRAVYSKEDVQAVIRYAKERGIRVVPEFDMPGHSYSWGKGYPFMTPNCPNAATNLNNVPMNPTDERVYSLITGFLNEVAATFPDKHIHLGGDEVSILCWKEDPTILAWMQNNGMGSNYTMLAQYFEKRLMPIVMATGKSMICWQEVLLDSVVPLPQDVIVESWIKPADIASIVKQGYRALQAAGWYLDQQNPSDTPHYLWGDTWIDFYNNDPVVAGLTAQQASLILGGEGAMWGEQVDDTNWDARVWPRAAAIAERLWSPASVNDINSAQARLILHRCMMVARGVAAGPIRPDYCPAVYLIFQSDFETPAQTFWREFKKNGNQFQF